MDKLEAAATIRKLAKQFESMVEAAAILEETGSFEQAVKEAKSSLTAIQGQRELAAKALQAVEAESDQARLRILDTIKQAEDRAAALIGEADATAHDEIEAAEAQALAILSEARVQAASIVAAAKREADADRSASATLKADAVRSQELVDAARAELSKILDQTAKAKESLRAFMQA
jgi:hypothetical protein